MAALSPQENFPIFSLENSFTLQLFHSFTLPLFEPSLTKKLKQWKFLSWVGIKLWVMEMACDTLMMAILISHKHQVMMPELVYWVIELLGADPVWWLKAGEE